MYTNTNTVRIARPAAAAPSTLVETAEALVTYYNRIARRLRAAEATGRRHGRDAARAAKFAARFGLVSDRAPFEAAGFDEGDM